MLLVGKSAPLGVEGTVCSPMDFALVSDSSFHGATAVSDHRVLISGGCNVKGALHFLPW